MSNTETERVQLTTKVSPSLMKTLKMQALREGITVQVYVNRELGRSLGMRVDGVRKGGK